MESVVLGASPFPFCSISQWAFHDEIRWIYSVDCDLIRFSSFLKG